MVIPKKGPPFFPAPAPVPPPALPRGPSPSRAPAAAPRPLSKPAPPLPAPVSLPVFVPNPPAPPIANRTIPSLAPIDPTAAAFPGATSATPPTPTVWVRESSDFEPGSISEEPTLGSGEIAKRPLLSPVGIFGGCAGKGLID